MVDPRERLQVLLKQESTIYGTTDYLAKMQAESRSLGSMSSDPSGKSSPGTPNKKRKSLATIQDAECDIPPPGQAHSEMKNEAAVSANSQINKYWREKICEWAYQVVDHFDLHRDVVCVAMNYLDRYLASYPHTVDKNYFQLLAMTCVYLAMKLSEYKHLIIQGSRSSMESILQLSRGYFSLEDMEKMEVDILNRLNWNVHPPTPQTFTKHFLLLLRIEEHDVHDLSQFLVELSVMDYFFINFKPSDIAIAAVLLATDRLRPHSNIRFNFPFDNDLINIESSQIYACCERLHLIYNQASNQAADYSSRQAINENAERTTSPVSVMATHQAQNEMDYSMDADYSDDEDL